MKTIVVIIEGGLVADVISEEPVNVVHIDRDVDGADIEDITIVKGEECFARYYNSTCDSKLVKEYKEEVC